MQVEVIGEGRYEGVSRFSAYNLVLMAQKNYNASAISDIESAILKILTN